jgi:hypothetical protein
MTLGAAKMCVFMEVTDLFCVVTGVLVEGAIALGDCTRRILEEPDH